MLLCSSCKRHVVVELMRSTCEIAALKQKRQPVVCAVLELCSGQMRKKECTRSVSVTVRVEVWGCWQSSRRVVGVETVFEKCPSEVLTFGK